MNIGYRAALLLSSSIAATLAADAGSILQRFVEQSSANAKRASQYTYVQQVEHYTIEPAGSAKLERSETVEIIFVEGGEYQKLIARNGHPLDTKEQAKEDQRLAQTAAERRKQHHGSLLQKEVSLGSNTDLLTLFESRLIGEDELGGHKTWVIEATPLASHKPVSKHEKEAMSFSRKLWIDQNDYVAVRSSETVVGDHIVLMPGTTITIEYEKINQDAWIQTALVIDGRLQIAKFIKPRVRTEYHSSNFQKFDVKSTITTSPRP